MVGRISLLGEVACTGPAGSVDRRRLAPRRTRVALARLVLARGEPVTRDALAEAVWSDDLPPTWEAALRTVIADVRAVLVRSGWERTVLSGSSGTLRLDLDALGVDVDVFDVEDDLAAAEAALQRDDGATALERARSAVEVLRRPFITDAEGGWVEERRRLQQQALANGLERLGTAALLVGDHPLALEAAEQAVRLQPLSEPAHRALARAHIATGDRRAALAAYERCRVMLAEELGVAPSPATEALHLELLGGTIAARPLPPGLRVPARFRLVGRRSERAAVATAWERASLGDGRVVVVRGEAGSGKSRLIADVAIEAHGDGATVRYGRCMDDGPPMAALIEAGAPPPGGERDEWLVRLSSWLADLASTSPVMLVLDDVQFAGRGFVVALRQLARAVSDRAACLVLTARSWPGHRPPPIAALLAELTRDGLVDDVALHTLTSEDVAALVGQLAEHPLDDTAQVWTADLARHTGGNALFVTESLQWLWDTGAIGCDDAGRWSARAAADAGGPGVATLVAGRVAGLGPGPADVLAAAAVAGDPFDLRLVAHGTTGDMSEVVEAIDSALAAGLVVDDPNDGRLWRFSHAIIHEAVIRSVPVARRMDLHHHIGMAIDGDRTLGSIADAARHLVAAAPLGDIERAVSYAVAAAEEATSSHAAEDAVELLDGALDLPVADEVRAGLMVRRGYALRDCGRGAESRAAFDSAVEIARRCGAGAVLAAAAIGATRGWGHRSQWVGDDDGRQLLEEALGPLNPGVMRIRLLGELALLTQDAKRQSLAAEALRLVEGQATTEALVAGYPAALVAHWSPADTQIRLDYAARLIERVDIDPRRRATVRLDRLADLIRAADRRTFDAERSELSDEIEALGDRRPRWAIRTFDVLVETMAGRWEAAAAIADEIIGVWQGSPDVDALMSHAGQVAWAAALAGDGIRLVDVARLGIEAFPDVRIYRCALAMAAAQTGDLATASETVDGIAEDDWSGLPRDSGYAAAVVGAAAAVAAIGDRERAASLLELALPFADHVAVLSGPSLFLGPVALALGRLAVLLDRRDQADELFAHASERAAQVGAPPWEAWARRSLSGRAAVIT